MNSFTYPKFQAFDNNGIFLVGGKLHTYEAGTGNYNRKTTYSDVEKTTAHLNPIILDARAEKSIYGNGTYKFVLTDASDNQIWELDGVSLSTIDYYTTPEEYGAIGNGSADDTDAFLEAVATGKNVLLTQIYNIDDTIIGNANQTIFANNWQSKIIWSGGDIPIFARDGYDDVSTGGGIDNFMLKGIRIDDNCPERVDNWSIDFNNSNGCVLDHVYLSCVNTGNITDKFGVFMGDAIGKTWTGQSFLAEIKNQSRIQNGKVFLNTTDSFINNSIVWGTYRDYALRIGGSANSIQGNQLIGGSTYGAIWLNSPLGYGMDALRIIGNHLDGSSYYFNGLYGYPLDPNEGTRYAIYSEDPEITNSIIANNTCWYLDAGGFYLPKIYKSIIVGNTFEECDLYDVGYEDIAIGDSFGNSITGNTHFRSVEAPGTEAARENLGSPLTIYAKIGYDYTVVTGNSASYAASYNQCTYTNDEIRFGANSDLFTRYQVYGTTGERPANLPATEAGYQYWDTTIDKLIIWDGVAWVDTDGGSL